MNRELLENLTKEDLIVLLMMYKETCDKVSGWAGSIMQSTKYIEISHGYADLVKRNITVNEEIVNNYISLCNLKNS